MLMRFRPILRVILYIAVAAALLAYVKWIVVDAVRAEIRPLSDRVRVVESEVHNSQTERRIDAAAEQNEFLHSMADSLKSIDNKTPGRSQ